jgi:hypothetical protein
MGEQLSNCSLTEAVCPLFWMSHENEKMEQIGSGVLVQLHEELFLLTAAHVTDASETGDLYMPAEEKLVPVNGHFAHNPAPSGSKRNVDQLDIAYFCLSPELRAALHRTFRPICPNEIDPFDEPSIHDYYTFVGYPWRKSTKTGNKLASEQFTFSEHRVIDQLYQHFGYSLKSHYVIRFRRNKSFSKRYMCLSPAPHPAGVSGGAIFAWPKEVDNEPDVPNLKLVGICHTYHSDKHLLVGTHVGVYLWGIQNNNPSLPIFEKVCD